MKIRVADWASVAEIPGAVAIVISLYFVSSELRDGNRETRAATTQTTLDSAMAFNAEILRYADVWEKVLVGIWNDRNVVLLSGVCRNRHATILGTIALENH